MKVLVVGSGGREHAIVTSISKSDKVSKIYCAPGNAGIAALAECVDIGVMDFDKLVAFAKDKAVDLVVVAPDDPLVAGAVDAFEAAGIRAFGPRANAAIIEGSKAFSKDLMKKYGIPTAAYENFTDADSALKYLETATFPIVLKADGLALGKGVLICNDLEEAKAGVKEIMLDKHFGSAGNTMVIEEFMTGREVSVLCFCDGTTIKPMTSAQDHKRAKDGDQGLNTGGMGTFSPSPFYTKEIDEYCMENIYKPTMVAMKAEGREFKGVLFCGLMMTPNGVKVLEYNARFGDPEAQVVGAATEMMKNKKVGDSFADFVGPLGCPSEFCKEDIEELKKKKILFVAGGVGTAPVYPQVKWLHEQGIDADVIIGGRNKSLIILEDKMKKVAGNLYITTDDGSYGSKGVVTNEIQKLVDAGNKYDVCVAIGPMIMMKFVCKLTKELEIPTVVSLNPIMVDGTGMCGACRVTVGGEVKFACVDGPEFDGHKVNFEEAMQRQQLYKTAEGRAFLAAKEGDTHHGGCGNCGGDK